MSRTLKDFTPGERNAYVVWNQKLDDRTLSAAEHDTARAELDKLFQRGPYAELHVLKGEHESMKERLARLESFVFSADSPDASRANMERFNEFLANNSAERYATGGYRVPPEASPFLDSRLGVPHTPSVDEQAPAPRLPDGADHPVIRADVNQTVAKQEATTTDPEAYGDPGARETRGRKPLRFHPQKNANKSWSILDREKKVHTVHGPYKTRKEAKEMADTLNKMPRVADSVLQSTPAPEAFDPVADGGASLPNTDKGFVAAVAGSVAAKSGGPQGGGGAVDTPTRQAAVDAAVKTPGAEAPSAPDSVQTPAPVPDASNEDPSLFPEMGF